ncbi:MAG: glycosyltransferase family 2 protein, partial [Victivallaceae bacterium]|nr:glycosyltransferase family 2 protein [Victivallaceae bacterium]
MNKKENEVLEHTFVIPCYGDSSFLCECIESLLVQTQKSNILLTTATPSEHITTIADKGSLIIK